MQFLGFHRRESLKKEKRKKDSVRANQNVESQFFDEEEDDEDDQFQSARDNNDNENSFGQNYVRYERNFDYNFYSEANDDDEDDQLDSFGSDVFDGNHPIYQHEDVMQDEGVAEWTLQREQQQYMYKRQQRIKNKDVAFLMRVRSRIEFKDHDDHVKYLKAKLKDLAHNHQ